MLAFFHTFISDPLYNGFIFLFDTLPFLDAGMIVIVFTIIVKLILLPLSIKASKAQLQMKSSEKDLQKLKEKYKNDKQQLGLKTMEYYKEKGINPFSGILILVIQIPILIGLYRVFLVSGLPEINKGLLYPFVGVPEQINMVFLGLINISEKSLILALLAGLTTYFQVSIANSRTKEELASQSDLARAMSSQMKYFLPVMMVIVGYTVSSAIAIYLIASNIFAIVQEWYIKTKYHKAVFVE
jgi:YidC/Oxa1 family membrane protein insertase